MYKRRATIPAAERFWAKVEKTDTCWLWTGARSNNGYGRITLSQPIRSVYVHRFAYELQTGPIPDGLQIDHLCRVRNCVRGSHLEAVTSRENTLRGTAPAAMNARKTRCHNGHELAPRARRAGWRRCQPCERERRRASA